MSRRDPKRIYAARRAATFRRLVDVDHLDELDAEHWIARWEREAAERGVERFTPEFWDDGALRLWDVKQGTRVDD